MTLRILGLIGAALLFGCVVLPPHVPDVPDAASPACTATATRGAGDARIRIAIDEALRQHRLFGAQTIGQDGSLLRIGHHEAAWSRLRGESAPAWERVAVFWSAVPESDAPGVMTSVGRVALSRVPLPAADADGAPGAAEVAVREALLRAAMMDTPWSAAFISHLMKTAGFSRSEFEPSDRHAHYVRAALDASADEAAGREPTHAFRACDVATTRPRAGDLLCATRASTAHITVFGDLPAALVARPPALGFPMHCDLVVHADEGGDGRLEVIGGNVLNSVTLSRMTLDAKGMLSDAYLAGAAQRSACAAGGPPCGPHLSRRPWLVLLQFRH